MKRYFAVFLILLIAVFCCMQTREIINLRFVITPFNKTNVIGGNTYLMPAFIYKEGDRIKRKRIKLSYIIYKLDNKTIYETKKPPFFVKYDFRHIKNGSYKLSSKAIAKNGREYLFNTNIIISNITISIRLSADLPKDRSVYITGNIPPLGAINGKWNPRGMKMKKLNSKLYEAKIIAGINERISYEYTLGSWATKGRDKNGNTIHKNIIALSNGQVFLDNVDNWGKVRGKVGADGYVIGFEGSITNVVITYTKPIAKKVKLRYWYNNKAYSMVSKLTQFASFHVRGVRGKRLFFSSGDKTNSIYIPRESLPFSFVVIGDVRGSGDRITSMVAKESNIAFVIDTGDIVFSGLSAGDWNGFFKNYRGILERFFYQPTPGNHEEESPLYRAIMGRSFWYYFEFANSLFISIDNNAPFERDTEQYKWLESILKSSKKRFRFVFFHIPPYSSRNHGSDLLTRKVLCPLFEKYGVNVVFSGHDHGYEASYPLKDNKLDKGGVVYIVAAGGGASLYNAKAKKPYWSRLQKKCFHYLRVVVYNDRVVINAIDDKGKIFDKIEIR